MLSKNTANRWWMPILLALILAITLPAPLVIAQPDTAPTVATYARLSQLSYFSDPDNNDLPDGWHFLQDSNGNRTLERAQRRRGHRNDPLGYYGMAVGNGTTIDTSTEVVIVHRGTDRVFNDLLNLIRGSILPGDIEDNLLIFLGIVPLQYEPILPFVGWGARRFDRAILKQVERLDNPPNVTFTGHSLGAALAVYSAVEFDYPAITFESPGVRKSIQSWWSSVLGIDYSSSELPPITIYMGPPNLINSAGPHIGNMVLVYSDYADIVRHNDTQFDYLGDAHSMKKIAERLEAIENGTTDHVMIDDVEDDWPRGPLRAWHFFEIGEFLRNDPQSIGEHDGVEVLLVTMQNVLQMRDTEVFVQVNAARNDADCVQMRAFTNGDNTPFFDRRVNDFDNDIRIRVDAPSDTWEYEQIIIEVQICDTSTVLSAVVTFENHQPTIRTP